LWAIEWNNPGRLTLVSSLYGPGAIGCWLAIVGSVFVSWTVNKDTRKVDLITNDLIATLTLPVVAAGHLVYQIATFPGPRRDILTTLEPGLVQYVAALEAALTVCDTFVSLGLLLIVVAAWKLQFKRCLSIAFVGLICFGTEGALFLISAGSDIRRSNFSRPFSLNVQPAMIFLIVITTVLSTTFLSLWILRRDVKEAAAQSRQNNCEPQDRRDWPPSLQVGTLLTTIYLPLALAASFGIPLGAMGTTVLGALHSFVWRFRFFMPESNAGLTDLDQAVALTGGVATFAFSCWEAVQSHREKAEESTDGSA